MICFEDQTIEVLTDMRERILSYIAAKGTVSQFIPSELTILSPGTEYPEEQQEDYVKLEKSNKQEPTFIKEKEVTVSETRNQPVSEPRMKRGNGENNIEKMFVGSCGHPPGDESEPGGELREQDPVQTSGRDRREAEAATTRTETDRCTDSGTSSRCQPALGRRVMVPGRGHTRLKKQSGTITMRRIEDLIELMGSSQKRKKNECVENGLKKRPRGCGELM